MNLKKIGCVAWVFWVVAVTGCQFMASDKAAQTADASVQADARAQAAAQLPQMIQTGKAYTTEEILPLYDRLEPVDIDFMLGTWKGGKFDAGKSPDPINWYGKRFNSANDAEPLLARKPDGTIYSFDKWGLAQLREVKFRGKVSASLIYDNKPIMDYFRKIDDNTLIGLGEMKGNLTFFFYLTREKATAVK